MKRRNIETLPWISVAITHSWASGSNAEYASPRTFACAAATRFLTSAISSRVPKATA